MAEQMVDCDPETLYAYAGQRWLWNEAAQLQRRYVQFNLHALIQIAEEAAGQVRERLNIPTPNVLGYCARASERKLGVEYIVMKEARGVELVRIWGDLKAREKASILNRIAAITCSLARSRFPCHGALYRKQDVSPTESVAVDDEFVVGPTVGRAWFDDRRGEVDIPRGPWTSVERFMKDLVRREAACLENFSQSPRDCQQGIFGGPGGYNPIKEAKLSVLQDFLQISPHSLPKNDALSAGTLWHNDLHTDNIFVDANNPSQPTITSIIDWQAELICTMFLTAHHPSIIDYEGPRLDAFVQPALPENFASLDPAAKKAAKELFLSQSFWICYEIDILGTVGFIYNDGEPYVQSLLANLTEDRVWKQVVGMNTAMQAERQKAEYAKWEKDVERKARVFDETGVYTGWNGAVPPGDYYEIAGRLAAAKQRFLDRESASEQERVLWEKVWPFQYHLMK
ncbi:hypothetical protein BDW62DRAFT_214836 [Aspergillus aurantiobrunneus]